MHFLTTLSVLLCAASIQNLHGQLAPRSDFFQDIMGISEKKFKDECVGQNKFLDMFSIGQSEQGLAIMPLRDDSSSILCGSFKEYSIGKLIATCSTKPLLGGGTCSVIEGFQTGPNCPFRRFVDIGALQADQSFNDAVFQVASNFNGLETVNAHQSIDKQYLESYISDRTQGPAASISAAPGLILRRYLLHWNEENPTNMWQQTTENAVNFLSAIPKETGLTVSRAGYAMLDDSLVQPTDDHYHAIKIGYHKNTQVTYGFMHDGAQHESLLGAENPQIINQVFTAAIDFGNTNYHMLKNDNAQRWGKLILNAAYEGTLRAAFVDGKKRVVLTLIGGGVFANTLSSIFDAINRMKDFIIESGLEVTIIWYRSDVSDNDNAFRENLKQLVTATRGVYKLYKL